VGARKDNGASSWSYGAFDRVRDRIRDWRGDARFGVALLVLIALVAGVAWYRVGVGGASAGEQQSSSAPSRRATATANTAAADLPVADHDPVPAGSAPNAPKGQPAKVFVHVAGAVVHPGVVELAAGSRAIDAIEAVGGALAEGDLDRLNLAAKVVDGERVYVARAGEADPGVLGADPSGSGAAPAGSVAGKVNLNTATQAQLEELPGVGPTYALAIIAERQRRGGFKSVNELRNVHGIGDKRFAELAPLVTV
jgi:competence protein ComEA